MTVRITVPLARFSRAAIAGFLVLATIASAQITNDLVAHYTLDSDGSEAAGRVSIDTTNSLTAIPVGDGVTFGVSGPIGSATDFAGNGDYLWIDADGSGDETETAETTLDFTNAQMTASLWFNTEGDWEAQWEALMAKQDGSEWRIHRASLNAGIQINAASGVGLATTATFLDTGWHHLACVIDRAGSNVSLYVDGVLDASSTGAIAYSADGVKDLQIGSNPDRLDRYFDGQMDDIGLWGRSLSAKEVAAIHALGKTHGIDLEDSDIDAFITAFDGAGNATNIGPSNDTWNYVTGLSGPVGTYTEPVITVVFDSSSNGMQLAQDARVYVGEPSGAVVEGGPSGSYNVQLYTVPAAAIKVMAIAPSGMEVSNDGATYGGTAELTFSNSTAVGTFFCRALDDGNYENDHTHTITHGISAGDGGDYTGAMSVDDTVVSVLDAPVPNIGDIAVYNNSGGTAVGTTYEGGTTPQITNSFPNTVVEPGGAYALGSDHQAIVMSAGKHLVLYNSRLDNVSGGGRAEALSNLAIDGSDIQYGWGQGYIRNSSGADEMVISGGAVIDVGTNSLLQLKTTRTDDNTNKVVNVIPDHTAIQLLKLDDGLDCLRVTRTTDTPAATSATFIDVTYDQVDEASSGAIGFTSPSGDITLNNTGHYLVLANTAVQTPKIDGRTGYTGQLTLDGVAVEGSKTTTYLRGNVDTHQVNDGVFSIGMIVKASAGQVLNVEQMKEDGINATNIADRTSLTVVALPGSGEFIRLEDTSGQDLNDGILPVSFTNQPSAPSAVFSHSITTNSSQVTVNAMGRYLFLGAYFCDEDTTDRQMPWQQWRVNGSVLSYGETARYSRNQNANNNGNWSGIMAPLEAGDVVDMITQRLGNGGVLPGHSIGLQGVRITSLTTSPVLLINEPLGSVDGAAMTVTSNTLMTVDSDTAAAGLTYTLTSAVSGGTLTRLSATLVLSNTFTQADIDTGFIEFTPSGIGRSTAFTFSVSDGASPPSKGAFRINVVDAVSPSADTGATDEDTVGTTLTNGVSVLANDTGDGLTVTAFDAVSAKGAKVNVNSDGTFTYDPVWGTEMRALANGTNLVDTFDYTATDSIGESSSATVSITVTGTNDHFGAVNNVVADTNVVDASAAQAVTVDITLNDGIVQTPNGGTNDNLLLNYDASASLGQGRWENLGFGAGASGTHDLDWHFGRGVTLNRGIVSSHAGIAAAYEYDGSIDAIGYFNGTTGTGQQSIHGIAVSKPDQSDASFEFWVKLEADDLTQNTTIFETGGGTGIGIIVNSNGVLTAASEIDGATGVESTVSYDLIADTQGLLTGGGVTNDFNQFGLTVELNAGLALYVNGVLVDESTSGVIGDWDGGDDNGLGHFRGSNHSGFQNGAAGTVYDTHLHGAIAIMRVYSGILITPEFVQNYNAINLGGRDAEGNAIVVNGVYDTSTNLVAGTNTPVTLASGGVVTLNSNTGDFTFNASTISDIGMLQLGESTTDRFSVQMGDGTGETRDAEVSVFVYGKNQARAVTLEADELVTTHFRASEIVGGSDHGVGAVDPFLRFDANAYTGGSTWANEGSGGSLYDATITSGPAIPAMSEFGGIGTVLPDPRGTLTSLNAIGTEDATFEVWFKPDLSGTANQLLFEVGGDGIGTSLVYDDSLGILRFTVDDDTVVVPLEASGISRTEYNQVVAVYDRDSDGSNDVLRLYINNDPTSFSGTPVATTPLGTTQLNQFSNTDGSGIGAPNNTYADTATVVPFEGKLVAVRVYSRVLTTTEIETNFDTMAHPITALADVPPGTPGPSVITSMLGADVTLNADGSVDYDATSLNSGDIAKGVVQQDYFTFVISDGEGGSISNTVTVNVTGVDTGGAEFLAVDDLVSVGQNAAATAFDPRTNDLGAGSAVIQPFQTHVTSYDEAWTAGTVVGEEAVFTNAAGHGWRFLWNAPSAWTGTNTAGNATNGFFGIEAGYIPLKWSGTVWSGDGDDNQGNGDVSEWLRLTDVGGHPGRGSNEPEGVSNNVARGPIAAYTVPSNGTYVIVNSTITVGHAAGDDDVMVYVNDDLRKTVFVPGTQTRNFDVELGELVAGDDIYVAVSPGIDNGNDGFTWDFDIVTLPSAESELVDTRGIFTTDGTSITYDPNGKFAMLAAGESVFETVTYTIVDGADSSTADFTVEVVGVNDPPVNVNDSYGTDEDTPLTIDGVLDNDYDPDTGETLTITVAEVQGATGNVGAGTPTDKGGSVTVQADGSFVYDPGTAFQGLPAGGADSDSFTYLIEDTHGLDATNAATVTISISGNDDGVDARDDFFSTGVENAFDGNLLVDNGAGPDTSIDDGESLTIESIDTTGMVGTLWGRGKVSRVIGTCGSASVSDTKITVTHGLTLTNPVVIAGPPSNNEAEPCVVRVYNVTATAFDIQIHEQPEGGAADDGDGAAHASEEVHWLVLEEGRHQLPSGQLIEVGTVDTAAIRHDSTNSPAGWETVTYETGFLTPPAVLNTIQTLNGTATENGERFGTRMQNVTNTSFQVALEDHEGDTAARTTAETIGWIAIEPGDGTWGGGPFETGTTPAVYEEGFKALNFVRTYGPTGRFFASTTIVGGADPVQLRRQAVGATSVNLTALEDTFNDTEQGHAPESVAYVVIDSDGAALEAYDQPGINGDFTYEPGGAAAWRGNLGPETFTYTVSDGRGNTDTATATINILFGTMFIVR